MSKIMASLVVSADALADALKKFKNIVPKPMGYGSIVLRDNILLGFTQDYKLRLCADNGEIGLNVVVDAAESHGMSSLVVSYSGLVAAVAAFKHEDLLLYLSDTLSLRGQSDGGMAECLSTCSVDKYPAITETAEVEPLVFSAQNFMDALKVVAPCTEAGDGKNALQHVYFASRAHSGVEMVATDSHRMAVYAFPGVTGHISEASESPKMPTPEDTAKAQHITGLNNRAVSWLLRHAGRSGDIAIRFDKKHAEIAGSGWTLYSKLNDGRYPPYHNVIDDIPDMPGKLVVKRAELLDTLRKAKTTARDESHTITLAGSGNGEALDVYCKTGERVIFTATIPAASRKLPGFTATCDYLIDMVAAFPDDLFEFRFPARGESGFILARSGSLLHILSPREGMDTTKPDYLAALAGSDQDYPGVVDTTPSMPVLTKRPPPFKAVVKHALADAGYRRTLLKALGILPTVA